MGRKLKETAVAEVAAAKTVSATVDRSTIAGVTTVLVPSRPLFTIDSASELWVGGAVDPKIVAGAIIRLIPPANATAVQVDLMATSLRAAGAAVVRIAPRVNGDQVIAKTAETKVESIRTVVMQMVDEARLTDADRGELREVLEMALVAEGV